MFSKEQTQASPPSRGLIAHPEQSLFSSLSEFSSSLSHVLTETLDWQPALDAEVEVCVRRDDLVHPALGGNKRYKLWGHVQDWLQSGKDVLVSCGGAYSNHLYALAALGQLAKVKTFAIIRGERPQNLSPTLQDIESMGMHLRFVSRSEFRQMNSAKWLRDIENELGLSCYWIPEGGGSESGMRACSALGEHLGAQDWDAVLHACGTGTTVLGIADGLVKAKSKAELIGISVLRSRNSLAINLANQVGNTPINWTISNQFHAGGYAKSNNELDQFREQFTSDTGIALDRVYTGKVFYALSNMLCTGRFKKGSRILVVHSGGLQGNRLTA